LQIHHFGPVISLHRFIYRFHHVLHMAFLQI
jgi:hypothetical protein